MGYPRPNSAESPALLTILFRSLVACSHAAIFVLFPESFPTLLIASLGLDLFLLHFLLSYLENIRFRPTGQVVSWQIAARGI
jgi:hypothetical protein